MVGRFMSPRSLSVSKLYQLIWNFFPMLIHRISAFQQYELSAMFFQIRFSIMRFKLWLKKLKCRNQQKLFYKIDYSQNVEILQSGTAFRVWVRVRLPYLMRQNSRYIFSI